MGKTRLAKRGVDPERLTDKQRRFCSEYIIDYNGKRAATAAGYAAGSAQVQASKLLKNPLIKRWVGKCELQVLEANGINASEVILQLWYQLTRRVDDFVGPDGEILPISEMNPRAQACIDGFKQKVFFDKEGNRERIETEVKLSPKAQALALAMQHKGLLNQLLDGEKSRKVDWDSLLEEPEDPSNVIDAEFTLIPMDPVP